MKLQATDKIVAAKIATACLCRQFVIRFDIAQPLGDPKLFISKTQLHKQK
jgi:hypothetical protein